MFLFFVFAYFPLGSIVRPLFFMLGLVDLDPLGYDPVFASRIPHRNQEDSSLEQPVGWSPTVFAAAGIPNRNQEDSCSE